jgi:YCII-related domain
VAKFMVLYRSSVDASEQMASASPEQAQEGMAMWMRWSEKAGPAIVDLGSPLGNPRLVPMGADAATGTPIGGFSILDADSADDVAKLLDDHPHLHAPGAVLEVLEFLPMPGM